MSEILLFAKNIYSFARRFILAFILLLMGLCVFSISSNAQNYTPNFVSYQKDTFDISPEGVPVELSVRLGIPVDSLENRTNIIKGIREIIAHSKVGNEFKMSKSDLLQDIINSFINQFPKRVTSGKIPPNNRHDLYIDFAYQNTNSIVFHVVDGVYTNGGPNEYYETIRLADGHVFLRTELIDISNSEIVRLARKYAENDDDVGYYELDEGVYDISPATNGLKLHFPKGNHDFEEVTLPLDDVDSYLTNEGKSIFYAQAISGNKDEQFSTRGSEIVFTKGWWTGLALFSKMPKTESKLALYCILVLGLIGVLTILKSKKRVQKMVFVMLLGGLELYYFIFYKYSTCWFYEGDSRWYIMFFASIAIVMILITQCLATDELSIDDNLEGDNRVVALGGLFSTSVLLVSAAAVVIVSIISIWIKSDPIISFINNIALIGVLTFLFYRIKNQNQSVLLPMLASSISLGGILITIANCFWTGIFACLLIILFSGVRQERSKTHRIKIKADNGDIESIYMLGEKYLKGGGIRKDEAKAIECFQESATKGHAKAYNTLAECYMNGIGVDVDLQKGLEMAKKSLELGYEEANISIGELLFKQGVRYACGKGVEKNVQKAVELYKQACDYQNPKAYNNLAICFFLGSGISKDGEMGLNLAKKSFELGNMNACCAIRDYYISGDFEPQNYAEAHKWALIGAKAGITYCQIKVADDFELGRGTEKDRRKASSWYEKVADNVKASSEDRGYACWEYAMIMGGFGNITIAKDYIKKAQELGYEKAITEGPEWLKFIRDIKTGKYD